MLTPQQISALRDRAGQVTDPIVEYLIQDIAERVSEAGQLTSTAAYQTWTIQKLGVSQKELKRELKKLLGLTSKEIQQMFDQAARTGYANDIQRLGESGALSFEENTALQQIVDSSVKLANDDFENITQTMGFIGPDGRFHELTSAYQSSCDYAFEKVANGAQDYAGAVRDATRELAKRGIRVMDYETGVNTSLEAAVRRNIMGGLGLMNEQINQQNHDDLGCDGWEISAHAGSAPDHEPYQGKQYSDEEYKRLNNSLVRRISTLNCGHTAMAIILGVTEPQHTKEELEAFRQQNEEGVTYQGKHYTLYEATQRQRNLESAIRNRKRRILIDEKLGDKDALQTDQIRLQLLKQEYSRFSKAADLPMQHARMEAAGFDWKKGKEAENAYTEYEKQRDLRDPARFQDVVSIIPPYRGDAITHKSLYKNLRKSEVGKEAIEYIASGKCSVEVNYTDEAPKGVRGECFGSHITIYAKSTRTIKETAKTIIHEVTHSKYKIGGNQWAEAVCFSMEHIHEYGQLTFQDKRNIIKTVKELYPEYEWRKGGRNKWKKK